MASNISSISQALANGGGASSIYIPKPAGVPDYVNKEGNAPFAPYAHATTGLPTPPNSISPNLPAHSLAARARKDVVGSPPSQVDSDMELGDVVEHGKPMGIHPNTADNAYGAITPALIARDHLPGIILGKGQVPVKDVINHLCKALPGFADIPPAKARRIVGAALEGHVGGPEGNVEFEKTGWGRWNAKIRSQPLQTINENRPSSLRGSSSGAMKIPGNVYPQHKPRRTSNGSWAADSSLSSPSEPGEHDVFNQDVDAISLDGDDQHNRYAQRQTSVQHGDPNFLSDTDEEDWASMGPAAFRAGSYGSSGRVHKHYNTHRRPRTKSPALGGFSRSAPYHHTYHHPSQKSQAPQPMELDFTGIDANSQEREAIEALMRMGSM